MTYFGDYLRSARGSRSLQKAAAQIGCTKAHLWELENGRSDNPGIKLLAGIARAYSIPLDALARAWEGDTEPQQSAGRCETCAHWKFDEPDWEYDDLRFGTCKAILQREAITENAFEGSSVDRWSDEGEAINKAAIGAAKAIAVDGSGCYAAVRTAPDFGCVLYEAVAAEVGQREGEAER